MKSIYLLVYDRGHRRSVLELFTSCGSVLPELSRDVSRRAALSTRGSHSGCHRSGIYFNISVSIRISFCQVTSNKSPQVCHHRESIVSDSCTMCTSKECSRAPLITSATSDNTPTSGKPCCNGDVNPWCTTTRANLHVCLCRKSY